MIPADATGPASAGPFFDGLAKAVRVATGLVLVVLVILVGGEAALRGLFNHSLGYVEEVTGYLVVALTFFGAALALRSEALFRVDFLYNTLPEGARKWALRGFALLGLAICAILVWKTWGTMASSLDRGKVSSSVLRTPVWIPQLLMPAGFAVLGLFLVEKLIVSFRKNGDR
ncbi:TRAP transporter small permease [Mangrovicoccus ximenensis]|uniref:TRAP transporter small permease n=1 Tax=Mangrovicoccus ximenensis TaxID=1911570 RepID=UPI000D38B887|nr:TRAP transporter small permease [Mangrovicoccus ximenensis]